MQAAQGEIGRVFVLRLEDGDRIPDCIEGFAREQGIRGGLCAMLGGIGGGKVVVGPEDGQSATITPMLRTLDAVHEAAAVGTLFRNEAGDPKLHMHAALGRGDACVAGCVRQGVEVWKIAEVVIIEITGTGMQRKIDPNFGFEVLST